VSAICGFGDRNGLPFIDPNIELPCDWVPKGAGDFSDVNGLLYANHAPDATRDEIKATMKFLEYIDDCRTGRG
jgi:hypothetical protein